MRSGGGLTAILNRLERAFWPARSGIQGPRPRDRGAPPVARELPRSELAGPDTFILYRIIGNDLVPRHTKGQSRQNLRFILDHEPDLPSCEKRFIVNRIFDFAEEEAIIRMLEQARATYVRIPFVLDEYKEQAWDIDGVPLEYAPFTARFRKLSDAEQGRILMRLYRHKNNYVMNNNGARNLALREGKQLAKWTLPWDGNCFLSGPAWDQILESIRLNGSIPYHIVPMARVTNNSDVLNPAFRPVADEEPQIIFRQDTGEEFDADYYYGRRPKVELLWRLGVPGPWDDWLVEPWDLPCPQYSSEAGCFMRSGWVTRLFSGAADLEVGPSQDRRQARRSSSSWTRTSRARGMARVEAVRETLDQLDARAGAVPVQSWISSYVAPAAERGYCGLSGCGGSWSTLCAALERSAQFALTQRVYRSIADLHRDVLVLALAYKALGRFDCAEHAAILVQRSLDAGSPLGSTTNAWSVHYFLDAVRLIREEGALEQAVQDRLRDSLVKYLHLLRSSRIGRKERASSNHRGTYYDLQVASAALFLGDDRLVRSTVRDSCFRIIQQFPVEHAVRSPVLTRNFVHAQCLNIHAWVHLAMLANVVGERLWTFESADGHSLRLGMEQVLESLESSWIHSSDLHNARDHHLVILSSYEARYGAFQGKRRDRTHLPTMKAAAEPVDGIAPFWQIELLRAARPGDETLAQARSSFSRNHG